MIFSRTFIFSIIPCIVGVFGVGFQPNYANAGNCNYSQQKPDSVDIIITKYIDAIGGKEKLEAIHTIYVEGSALVRGQKIFIKTWTINKKASRTESTINGFTNWSITRTDSAWTFNPRRGQKFPEPSPADRVKIAQPALDLEGSLVDYKKKGYLVEYKGIDQIEGSDVYKIEVKLNDAITKTYYIDLDSYLIIRVRSRLTTSKVEYSNTDYSNYQKNADGYIFPMQLGSVKYSLIKVNPEIDNTLFIPKP